MSGDNINKISSDLKPKGFNDEDDEKLIRRPTNLNKKDNDFERILDQGTDQKKEDESILLQPMSFVSGENHSSFSKKEVPTKEVNLPFAQEIGEQGPSIVPDSSIPRIAKSSEKEEAVVSTTPVQEHSKSFLLSPDKIEPKERIKQEFSTLIKGIGKETHNFDERKIEAPQATQPLINPIMNPTNVTPVNQSNVTHFQNLVNLIAEHITLMETKHQTDTTVTIKNIPLFEGSTITISSYKTAKGEINISFDNLTQQAKNILDLAENRAALQVGLDQKGYTVHIITTTTIEKTYADATIPYKENRNEFTNHQQSAKDQQEQQKQNNKNS